MFSFFTNFLHGLNTMLMLAILGASVGVGCSLVSRIWGGLTGLGISAVVGAVMMLGAHWSGVVGQMASDSAKAEIAQLEADKAKLAHDLAALQEVRDFEFQQAEEQTRALEEEKEKLAKIEELIASHAGDNSQCVFQDELDEIFK